MNSFTFAAIVPGVVLGRIQHGNVIVHQLQHVLVARDDDHVEAGFGGLAAERADHVVRLVALALQQSGSAVRSISGARRGSVEQDRGGISVRFALYSAKCLFALRLPQALEHGRHVLRGERLGQLAQHIVEDQHRFGRNAGVVRMGGALHPRSRMIGAEDKAIGVDEKEPGPSALGY